MPLISVRLSIPRELLSNPKVVAEVARVQKTKTGPEVEKLFKNTTNGWEHNVDFTSNQKTTNRSIRVEIYPTGENTWLYILMVRGSRKHKIPKGGTTRMSFQPGYSSATHPGSLRSGRKQRFGSPVVAYSVNHPGFEGRRFDKNIASLYAFRFFYDMQTAMANAIYASAQESKRNPILIGGGT
jgi:hypothetical protein